MKLKKAIMLDWGGIAVFSESGQQVADLQQAPLKLWAELATKLGFNVNGLTVEVWDGQVWEMSISVSGEWNIVRRR